MSDLRTAAQQALEALRGYRRELGDRQPCDAEQALDAALAEPVREPVGYLPAYELNRLQSGHDGRLRSAKFGRSALDGDVAVYTAPPQRKPLSEEEIEKINRDLPLLHMQASKGSVAVVFARAVEAAHGIKE